MSSAPRWPGSRRCLARRGSPRAGVHVPWCGSSGRHAPGRGSAQTGAGPAWGGGQSSATVCSSQGQRSWHASLLRFFLILLSCTARGAHLRQGKEGQEERRHGCAKLGFGRDDAAAACERVAPAAAFPQEKVLQTSKVTCKAVWFLVRVKQAAIRRAGEGKAYQAGLLTVLSPRPSPNLSHNLHFAAIQQCVGQGGHSAGARTGRSMRLCEQSRRMLDSDSSSHSAFLWLFSPNRRSCAQDAGCCDGVTAGKHLAHVSRGDKCFSGKSHGPKHARLQLQQLSCTRLPCRSTHRIVCTARL